MAVLTGVMIAEQARANSELSIRMGNSVEADFLWPHHYCCNYSL